ncbi:MAG: hypothetical protein WBC91_03455 [Phototrophicaceae bacterium]
MDAFTIEKRRIDLLHRLEREAHPLDIFYDLDINASAAFTVSDTALATIRAGLSKRQRRVNESVALVTVKVAGMTPDKLNVVYEISDFIFEGLGTKDSVLAAERDTLDVGEIEVHTHLFATPEYLGQTDVGDLIASIAGPAWVHPIMKMMQPTQRIFGILSIYRNRRVQFDFYEHDLRQPLIKSNNYGLKRLGLPIVIQNAY